MTTIIPRIAAVLAILSSAFASAESTTPVTLGASIVVTGEPVESAAVVIDDAQQAHIVMVTGLPRSLEHVTIGRNGNVEREVIDKFPPEGSPSAAFSGNGQLHLAIGSRMYVRSQDGWTPLREAPPCMTLVRTGTGIACA